MQMLLGHNQALSNIYLTGKSVHSLIKLLSAPIFFLIYRLLADHRL